MGVDTARSRLHRGRSVCRGEGPWRRTRSRSIVEDGDANLWIANQDLGLFRISTGSGRVDKIAWAELNLKDPASALAADRSQRGVWLGLPQGGVLYFADGQVRASYGVADGLGAGRVRSLRLDPDRSLVGRHGRRAQPAERRTRHDADQQERAAVRCGALEH